MTPPPTPPPKAAGSSAAREREKVTIRDGSSDSDEPGSEKEKRYGFISHICQGWGVQGIYFNKVTPVTRDF